MLLEEKKALRPWSVEESRRARQTMADRVVPSRVVYTAKVDEDGQPFVKARLTGRGDQDPDVLNLVASGRTAAPTVSSNGKFTALQVMASCKFSLEIGDVAGALLVADRLGRHETLLARQPAGDLSGLHQEQLL